MQSIPVDVAQLVAVAMGSPRAKIKNRQTGEVATDAQGRPVVIVPVALLEADESSEEDGAIERVHTTADVPAIRRGTPVVLAGLSARPYAFKAQSGETLAGVTFWASTITPAGPAGKSSG